MSLLTALPHTTLATSGWSTQYKTTAGTIAASKISFQDFHTNRGPIIVPNHVDKKAWIGISATITLAVAVIAQVKPFDSLCLATVFTSLNDTIDARI